ncbi:MAG: rRNA pseudouridine synthase [Chitinophagaceae bacterium]|nr:rRNA pseudouridine synthase [Chitinophagaceae bacterium]
MSQQPFKKFVVKKNNAAIKEKFKQEKKVAKKTRAEAINKRFEEKRALRNQGYAPNAQVPVQREPDKRQKYPQGNKKLETRNKKGESTAQPTTNYKPQTTNFKAPQTGNAKDVSFAEMPLNKFIAHCGVGSRRDAVPLIKEGKITVNGNVVTEPGFKVTDKDVIMFNGKKLFVTKNMVYILLNKPKDYITTTDDPQGRKTVLQLIKHATTERIYPIGRLDRNTSGVLLFTNDGELTQRLTHPSYNVKKVYEVKLDKPVTKAHFDKIVNGIKLEDGEIHADALAYADSNDKAIIGIEIHSGRNRIVRRIFEHFGYDVKALDRVMYASLTKKNVERGKWRYLSEKEIRLLKYSAPSRLNPNEKGKEKTFQKENIDLLGE